jgi:4'-phosphopantetheinyl transferase EntD
VTSTFHCRYRNVTDLPLGSAGVAEAWLAPAERDTWCAIRAADRRTAWLAGRIAAKELIAQCVASSSADGVRQLPPEIEIVSRSMDGTLGQRPRIFVSGRPIEWALSIAHTSRGVLVALATRGRTSLGVDLVMPQRRGESLDWCLTPAERNWLAALPRHTRPIERLWAMKEAAYKACQRGEGFAPERIEVVRSASGRWQGADGLRRLQCWRIDGQVAALAVAERRVA